MAVKTWVLVSENFDNAALTDKLRNVSGSIKITRMALADTAPTRQEDNKQVKCITNTAPADFDYERVIIFCHGWKIGTAGKHLCITRGDAPSSAADISAIIPVATLAAFINALARRDQIKSILLAACYSGVGESASFASRLAVECNKFVFSPDMNISGEAARNAILEYIQVVNPSVTTNANWAVACNQYNTKMKKYESGKNENKGIRINMS